jgi:hypothetical protein
MVYAVGKCKERPLLERSFLILCTIDFQKNAGGSESFSNAATICGSFG